MAESVRTFWKGYIRLALVTIPVRLVAAERAQATPKFHQIDRTSKQRIRYLKVTPGKGEVAKENIVMGYEIEPGNYVLMEKDELDAVRLETKHTIELTQFVDATEIDPLYFERPYYILPDGDIAEEGYLVIRDALRETKKVAIGQLTLRGRENLVALYPGGNGLVLDTLRYEHEIKDADDVFSSLGKAKPRKDMLDMAEQLIESRSAAFDPGQYKDHYADALRDLVKAKIAAGGTVPVEHDDEKSAKVIDFMEALKQSVKGGTKANAPAEKKKASPTAKPAPKSAAKKPSASKAKAPARRRAG